MIRGATISECGKYRYRLWRNTEKKLYRTCMFIMLNPSTADAEQDDPTIRRCINFATDWGYDTILVGNLFPYRATDPGDFLEAMHAGVDPKFTENLEHLREMMDRSEIIVCAWGNEAVINKIYPKNPNYLLKMLAVGQYKDNMRYLELSLNGIPKHPLYLKGDLTPQPFNFEDGKY